MQAVIFEIKQIDPNKKELAQFRELQQGKAIADYIPNRVRSKLKSVSAKLKTAAQHGVPTVLVIYNNVPVHRYGDPGEVLEAMFGEKSIVSEIPDDKRAPIRIGEPFLGGKRSVTPQHNTAVSAVAVLERLPDQRLVMRLHHNPFGKVRLDPETLRSLPIRQFVFPREDSSTLNTWSELE